MQFFNFFRSFFLISLLSVSYMAQATLVLQISKGNDQLTRIAVVPFNWSGTTPLPVSVSQVITDDLRLSGYFNPLSSEDMLSFPSTISQINVRDWNILKVPYVVIGDVTLVDNKLVLHYQLFDISTEKVLLSGKVEGLSTQLRSVAHSVSNAIFYKLAGLQGDFNSHLLYVSMHNNTDLSEPNSEQSANEQKKQPTLKSKRTYQLNVADADGKNAVTLLTSPKPLLSPTWSPDGSQIAYVSFEKGASAIYIQNLKTGKRELVVSGNSANTSPAWSPNGRYLAYSVSQDNASNIFIMDLTTKKSYQLTNSQFAINTEPTWFSDGKSILFTSDRGGSPQIYRMDLAFDSPDQVSSAGAPLRLTFDGSFNARAKLLPNDKGFVMVHREKGQDGFSIALQSFETGTVKELTAPSLVDSPNVSPGGWRIVYTIHKDNTDQLGIVTTTGRSAYVLPDIQGSVREPVWGL